MSNSINFVGRLGKDSERKQISNGQMLKFSVGENVGYGDKKTTNWWNCSLFGKQAEGNLMEFTKIPAHELFPFWVEIFDYSKEVQDESLLIKRKEIQERMKLLQNELDVLYVDDDENAKDIKEHLTLIGLNK